MLELLILAVIALAGWAQLPGWTILTGAVALMLAGWWRKVWLLRQHPQVPFSTKMTTYLVVSIVINVGLAALSYQAGRGVRWWLLSCCGLSS